MKYRRFARSCVSLHRGETISHLEAAREENLRDMQEHRRHTRHNMNKLRDDTAKALEAVKEKTN